MKRTLTAVSFALFAMGTAPAARALDDSHCDAGPHGDVRTYLRVDGADPDDPRADANGRIRLRGWLYIPNGTPPAGGFPVIVFNHGSEEAPRPKCVFADDFVHEQRYALFVPVRRGHEGSTGMYFEDYADREADEACSVLPAGCTASQRREFEQIATVEYLRDQRRDVADAIQFVKGEPGLDPHRIGVMGHSFGGIVSLFFNMLSGDDTRAIVDISAGAQSWQGNAYLREQLVAAVGAAQRPIFFLQPKNDVSTLPTADLSNVAAHRNMRWQAAIFADVPDALIEPCEEDPADPEEDSCADKAHARFVTDATQVAKWSPAVVDFLRRMGVK
jgi:pimeloyl-ACP methyl ester carboxylesterase